MESGFAEDKTRDWKTESEPVTVMQVKYNTIQYNTIQYNTIMKNQTVTCTRIAAVGIKRKLHRHICAVGHV